MSNWSRRLTIIPGYVGTTVLVIATLVTALTYTGADGQRYSLLNHFVSELGHTQDSKLAAVFNAALVFGALMLGLHLVGVGLRFGASSGISCASSALWSGSRARW